MARTLIPMDGSDTARPAQHETNRYGQIVASFLDRRSSLGLQPDCTSNTLAP